MRYVQGAKFWEIEREGAALVVRWGDGRKVQERRKAYATEGLAATEHDQMVASRLAIGYRPEQAEAQPALDLDTPEGMLVYGDWLLQRGDAFGEYLVALRQSPEVAPALLEAHRDEWLGPERPEVELGWRDGLVRSARIRGEGSAALVSDLVRRPLLRFLESLSVEGGLGVTAEAVIAAIVTHAPRPWTLRELELPWTQRDIADARGLWSVVPRLRRLRLPASAHVGDLDLPELTEAALRVRPQNAASIAEARLPRLERLELAGADLDRADVLAGLAPLLSGRHHPALRHLRFEAGGDDALIARLLRGDLPGRLESLIFDACHVTGAGVRALAAHRRRFGALRTLAVRYNRNDEASAAALAAAFPFAEATGGPVDDLEDEDDDRYDEIRE